MKNSRKNQHLLRLYIGKICLFLSALKITDDTIPHSSLFKFVQNTRSFLNHNQNYSNDI